jgi:hypothetical protein
MTVAERQGTSRGDTHDATTDDDDVVLGCRHQEPSIPESIVRIGVKGALKGPLAPIYSRCLMKA